MDIETELDQEGELDLVRPLTGFLEAVSTGNLLLLTGEFEATGVFECARCNAPIENVVKFELDEQFPVEGVPSSLNTQDYARVASDEPYPLFEGNHLMVESLLRQALLLNLPVQPLCPFGWEGDCPVARERGVLGLSKIEARPRASASPEETIPRNNPFAALLAGADPATDTDSVDADSVDADPAEDDAPL